MSPEVPNHGKALTVTVAEETFARIPVRTRVVMPGDDLDAFLVEFAGPVVRADDIVIVAGRIVAIAQGRSYRVDEIQPRRLATFLSRYITQTPHGVGLSMPETMEMALREAGTARILWASGVAGVSRLLGRRGDFSRIAGEKARRINGPAGGTLPPYDKAIVLGPTEPKQVAEHLKAVLGGSADVAIVDIDDIGGRVLGSTLGRAGDQRLVRVLGDNPLGQGHQSTPLGVVRRERTRSTQRRD